jgi:hypothetical protein
MRALSCAGQLRHEGVLQLKPFATYHSSTRSHPPRLTPRILSATDIAIKCEKTTKSVHAIQFRIISQLVVLAGSST